MRRMYGGLLLAFALGMIGCSSSNSTSSAANKPLTQDEWKQLPPAEKYEIATLERLKQGEPKLMEPREWDKFNRTVLLPSKRKEMPTK